MLPARAARIDGITAWIAFNAVNRFSRSILSHRSAALDSIGAISHTPTVVSRQSMRPKASIAWATTVSNAPGAARSPTGTAR
jgi:hypothetical protein